MNIIQKHICRCLIQKCNSGNVPLSFVPARQATVLNWLLDKHRKSQLSQQPEKEDDIEQETIMVPRDYKYLYPEFLPPANYRHRDRIREKLERQDMFCRRTMIEVPEFYVGSILAVNVADTYAPSKNTRFVGLCISRENDGLRTNFILRNHIDGNGIEIKYDMYSPLLQSIEVLKLEKRLDDELFYLRDCPPEYSTIQFDMEPIHLPTGSAVPLNTIKVPLGPRPWDKKWDIKNFKGLQPSNRVLGKRAATRLERSAKPWEKHDLMKQYRENINDEDVETVLKEVVLKTKKKSTKSQRRQ